MNLILFEQTVENGLAGDVTGNEIQNWFNDHSRLADWVFFNDLL
jgi:hypothetical protein